MSADKNDGIPLTPATATEVSGEVHEALTEAREACNAWLAARAHYRNAVARLRILAQEAAEHEQVAA
jgi:hypothetical protein